MKTTVPQWLAQGLLTLFVVFAALAAYDRWVLRPALVIGVVDVAEVYRAKEAEFTQILTKTLSQPHSEEDRQKALSMAKAFAQRLPAALDELPRECGCLVLLKTVVAGPAPNPVVLTAQLRRKVETPRKNRSPRRHLPHLERRYLRPDAVDPDH